MRKKDNDVSPKRFSVSELKKFDGKEGRPAYVALKGKVYDITNSNFWKEGKHMGRHSAGYDLSEMIINAPHDGEVFIKFRIVGELSEKESSREELVKKIEKLHLHS
ncbi:cytochrome b5 domain-containing protein, partial [Acidobacteriota bacterium]